MLNFHHVAGFPRSHHICDVIKHKQSELRNIDFKIESNKAENIFCFLLFLATFRVHTPNSISYTYAC